MTRPGSSRRRRRAERAAMEAGFPDTGESITEILRRVEPNLYEQPAVVAVKEYGRDTQPLAALRAQPAYTPHPEPQAQPDDTGPMRRMPKLRAVQARPRPARPYDAAIFTWSPILGQHIMLCGVCPPGRRSRFADPMAWHMPFGFEALRVSAHAAGWRLDRYARWACPACKNTAAYHAPYQLTFRATEAPTRAEPHLWEQWAHTDEETKRYLMARAELAALDDVNGSAQRGKHRAVTP